LAAETFTFFAFFDHIFKKAFGNFKSEQEAELLEAVAAVICSF